MPKYGRVILADEGIENADWIKSVGRWALPTDLNLLLRQQYPEATSEEERRAAIAELLALPVARKMPDGLRAEIRHRYGL